MRRKENNDNKTKNNYEGEDRNYIKIINVYAQPDNRKRIYEQLIVTIQTIKRAEPGIELIIGGDFNLDLSKEKSRLKQ